MIVQNPIESTRDSSSKKADIRSVVRRTLLTGISNLGRFGQRLQFPLKSGQLFPVPLQFRMQAQQCLMHLFQVVLQMRDGGFQLNDAVVRFKCHGIRNGGSRGRFRLRSAPASYRMTLSVSP